MFGRPGKCIACRQRIRIPKPDELPEGCRELYLKEHPEFLRKRRVAPPTPKKTQEAPEEEAVVLDSGEEEERAVPLDRLDRLQELCSFEHVIERKLKAWREGGSKAQVHPDENALLGYRDLLQQARDRYDEKLREALHEATEEVQQVNEQIARANLGVRMGEMPYKEYVDAVRPLRERRESLERRRRNLRGWLALHDPYLAGGLVAVRLEDVPCGELPLELPEPEALGEPLLREVVEELRAAFETQEKAAARLRTCQKMEKEGALSEARLEDCKADSRAARTRARGAVEFHRERLKHIAQDIENDIKAIQAHLDAVRKQFQEKTLDEGAYQAQEMRLLKVQTDLSRAAALAKRALTARGFREMPHPEGTFFQRMAKPDKEGAAAFGVDSYLLWGGAVALVMDIALIAAVKEAAAQAAYARAVGVALFLGAFVLAAIGAIPNRRTRGVLTLVFWPVLCLAGVICLHEISLSATAAGAVLRGESWYFMRPPILAYILAVLAVGGAGAWALAAFKKPRLAAGGVIAGVLVLSIAAGTDVLGLLSARPLLEGPEEVLPAGTRPGTFQVTFLVKNQGWRTVWLGGRYPQAPNAAQVVVEWRNADGFWQSAGPPRRIKLAKDTQWRPHEQSPMVMLRAGETAALQFFVSAGECRASLESRTPGLREQHFAFEVEAEEPLPPANALSEPPGPRSPDRATIEEVPVVEEAEVTLRGILRGQDGSFMLQMEVTLPGEKPALRRLEIGETICGRWSASEFSESRNSLTLTDGKNFLVMTPGQKLSLVLDDSEGQTGG